MKQDNETHIASALKFPIRIGGFDIVEILQFYIYYIWFVKITSNDLCSSVKIELRVRTSLRFTAKRKPENNEWI